MRIDNQSFAQLFTVLGLNLGGVHKYFTPEQAALEKEDQIKAFKSTKFYDHRTSPAGNISISF
jgi:hypothetical protein